MTYYDNDLADDELLTRAEVCARLRVTPVTLRRWHREGIAPPSIRVGREYRYPKAEFERFLKELMQVG